MAFGTRQNNEKDNQISVNTRSYQFMNREGFDPSALTVGAWNEMLSIRINPALEPSKQTEGRVFDYEKSVSTSLTIEKVGILLSRITNIILPAIDASEDKSIGVPLNGGESLIVVGTGKRLTGSIRPFLGVYKGINPDTKKPEMIMCYEFKKSTTVEDYNENDGSFTPVEVNVELDIFCDILKAFIMNCSNFGVHASRYVRRFYDKKILDSIDAIASKVGASTGGSSYNRSGYSNTRNVFASSNQQSSTSMDMVEPEEITDLNEFMND